MIKTELSLCLMAIIILTGICLAGKDSKDFPKLTGPYLGQKPPGKTPVVFAPGIVCTNGKEMMFGFFKKDSIFIFERIMPDFDKDWIYAPLYRTESKNGEWTKPRQSKNTGKPWFHAYPDAPEGTEIFFAWRKNLDGSGPTFDIDLWKVVKTSSGWLPPQRLSPSVNTDGFDSWPSVADDKTLYFFSNRKGGFGKSDLYRSKPQHGEYRAVENLGKFINSSLNDHDPFIAPDERYLLWCSDRPGGYGGNDLYIAYKQENGEWTGPFNLGETINTSANETRPYVTGNGRNLFFVRDVNSSRDIFWVDAKIIEKLRPYNL
ncbi:MAG: PD40 domain-containing protein [Candidatus Aminicenantes bacterium]|nr:PD40 domain-containing protein [Candidatus Aminicenantes bacterium]